MVRNLWVAGSSWLWGSRAVAVALRRRWRCGGVRGGGAVENGLCELATQSTIGIWSSARPWCAVAVAVRCGRTWLG